MLQLPKSKPFDRDPLTVGQIEKLVKIKKDYEKKLEQCYQEIEWNGQRFPWHNYII